MASLLRSLRGRASLRALLAALPRRRRRVTGTRPVPMRLEQYENPYRHGTCAADWTKK